MGNQVRVLGVVEPIGHGAGVVVNPPAHLFAKCGQQGAFGLALGAAVHPLAAIASDGGDAHDFTGQATIKALAPVGFLGCGVGRYFILMLDSKTPGMDLYGLLLRDGCFGFSWSCRKVSLSRSFISSGSFFISLLNRLVGCIFSIICTKRLSDHNAAFIFPLGEHFI